MARKRLKKHSGTKEDPQPESLSKDRLPDLPDDIIFKIISLFPTVAAIRMSLLSKQWKGIWTSITVLDFNDSRDVAYFERPSKEITARRKFFKFVDACLEHIGEERLITKFKLQMAFYGGSDRVDHWLRFPVERKVSELDLCFKLQRGAVYDLPSEILSLRSLTLLKLRGLDLFNLPRVSLPSLKVLHLMDDGVNNQSLQELVSGCPSLENLHLIGCYGLLNPRVSSLSLKSMEYSKVGEEKYRRRGERTMTVEAVNLHSFGYKEGNPRCKIILLHFELIRNLCFSNTCLTNQQLEDWIPQLSHLENLTFTTCSWSEPIRINNQHLKRLYFTFDSPQLDLVEAIVETPRLVNFSYTGYSMFKLSMDEPSLLNANIRVCGHPEKKTDYEEEWYRNLINFLSKLNGIKNVSIFCDSEKALIIPEELLESNPSPLPDLKYLEVETASSVFRRTMFKNSLRWISPSAKIKVIFKFKTWFDSAN